MGWKLFERINTQLAEAILKLREAEQSIPHNTAMYKQVLEKLDEITRVQRHLQSALGSGITASGERSVVGAIIINSTVITGNNAVVRTQGQDF